MKNKNGFTIVELLLVIVLIAVISAIIIPNILDALNESKEEKYIAIEKVIKKNLKLYNERNEQDFWSDSTRTCIIIPYTELITLSSQEIELDNCVVTNNNLYIFKTGDTYTYHTPITCDNNSYISSEPNDISNCVQLSN